jgi:hypothetical protein
VLFENQYVDTCASQQQPEDRSSRAAAGHAAGNVV